MSSSADGGFKSGQICYDEIKQDANYIVKIDENVELYVFILKCLKTWVMDHAKVCRSIAQSAQFDSGTDSIGTGTDSFGTN